MATERNYDIYNREMLGIIRALQTWRHFLEGNEHEVIILSDHKNLTHFQKPENLNHQQAWWAMYITRFNTKLMHVPGSKMVQSDALSRWPDHVPEEDEDNEDLVLLPDKLFINLIKIELVKNMTNILSTKGVPPIKSNLSDWKIEDGMLFYQEWCYIPDNNTIQKAIVQEIHESPMTRHPGRNTTLEMVQRHYWWYRLNLFNHIKSDFCDFSNQIPL